MTVFHIVIRTDLAALVFAALSGSVVPAFLGSSPLVGLSATSI